MEIAVPSAHEILIETLYSVISTGTERAFLLAEPNTETGASGFPSYPGYSNIGRVVEMGRSVHGVSIGDLVCTMAAHQSHVIVRPPLAEPRSGHNGEIFDTTRPSDLSWRVPDGLDGQTIKSCAAFMVATVGLFGASVADIVCGNLVLISGLGPIGLYAGQFARLSGGLPIIGVAGSPFRREVARAVGFDICFPTLEQCDLKSERLRRFDRAIFIEATGDPQNVLRVLSACPEGARVVLLGCSRGAVGEANLYTLVHRKAITLVGAHQPTRSSGDYLHRRWRMYWDADIALRMLVEKRVSAAPLMSHEFSSAHVEEAYGTLCQARDALNLLLIWKEP